jgi:hypothetical protein
VCVCWQGVRCASGRRPDLRHRGYGRSVALRISHIGVAEKKLQEKTINNILGVLSKPLRSAVDVEVSSHMPKIGSLKVERRCMRR